MNEEKLIWGASYIDDDLVCEAIDYKPRRIRLAPWACAAAAAVVMVTAFAVFARQIGSSPVLPPDPAYTGNSENTASASSSELDSQIVPVNSGYPDYTSPSRDPEPVDIGNGMTLTGTPLDSSELEEFSIDPDFCSEYLGAEGKEFLDSLEIPELEDLCRRAVWLAWCCLSPGGNVRHTSAVPVNANGWEPPYINGEKDADGWSRRYYETGYTYESFYNEYLRAFTKETIEEMFKEYNVFLNYNNELFCHDGARGGWLGEVHREYELISRSDTVIEFRRLIFHYNDEIPVMEYIPEYRNEYDLGVTDFKLVLTEDGWRIANIPDEYASTLEEIGEPVTPGTPTGDKRAYDVVFEEFIPENPTTYGPPLTADEVMDGLISNPDYPEYEVDSYYLVEVKRALTNEEYMKRNGWKESLSGDGFTIYEVMLVKDLISGEAPDYTEYIRIPAGYGAHIQKRHDPTYARGERFTVVLTKPYKGNDYVISVSDYCLRYDLPQMSFTENDKETMLYFRGNGPVRQPIPDLPFDTEEINIEAAYSTSQNPATYTQKIALDDLVEFLRTEWEQRGISSHFENHAEN